VVVTLSALPHDPVEASAQRLLAYALLALADREATLTRVDRSLALPSSVTPAMLRTMWRFHPLHAERRFRRLAEIDR
jgi:hypothetical protein